MDEKDFEIIGRWRQVPEGLEFEARALTKKSKRIVARTTAHISFDTYEDLLRTYGQAGVQQIEESTKETCRRLALQFPG